MKEDRLLLDADLALERGEFQTAAELYERALRADASSIPAGAGLGICLQKLGRPAEAMQHLSRVTAQDCPNPGAHVAFGQCSLALGDAGSALGAFERAIQLDPQAVRSRVLLGYALLAQNRFKDAVATVETAISLDPNFGAAHDLLAHVLPKLGRFVEAKSHAKTASELDPSNVGYAFRFAYAGQVEEADRAIFRRLAQYEGFPALPDKDRIRLHFAIAKADEDLGEYSSAAQHYVKGNEMALREMVRIGRSFNAEEHRREIDYILQGFPDARSLRPEYRGSPGELPVFIVGMMRSGTTLVEQVLSCHPQVGAAGEEPFWLEAGPEAHHKLIREQNRDTPRKTAERYIQTLQARSPGAARVCDKLPQNYMNLGVIHAILPEARIIHCRRDPKDVCLSLFTTPFATPPPFAHSAENIANAYRQYLRLMDRWRAILPADRFLEVDYEQLVTQKEATARGMVEFLGLEWDDACLFPERNPRTVDTPSQWQVRQPVYASSIGRWKRFAEWMRPQFEIWSRL